VSAPRFVPAEVHSMPGHVKQSTPCDALGCKNPGILRQSQAMNIASRMTKASLAT